MTTQELRELDAWIAEHVMGFKWGHFGFIKNGLPDFEREPIYLLPPSRFDVHSGNANPFPRDRVDDWKTRGSDSLIPKYTTDPAAAMSVLEKCAEKSDGAVEVVKAIKGKWGLCDGSTTKRGFQWADTLPIAICLFARELFKEGTK